MIYPAGGADMRAERYKQKHGLNSPPPLLNRHHQHPSTQDHEIIQLEFFNANKSEINRLVMSEDKGPKYFNWPTPKATEFPYKAPPKEKNPVVRGLPLVIGASLLESLPFVSKFLYNNAGFNKLRKIQILDEVGQRYDPTVIPVPTAEDRTPLPSYTDPSMVKAPETKKKEDDGNGNDNGNSSGSGSGDGTVLLPFYSITDYHEAYKSGKLTPSAVVEALLPLIRRDLPNRSPHSTAFVATRIEDVTAVAKASTARWAAGKPLGLLDGVPVAVKEEVDLKDYPQTYGSKRLFHDGTLGTSWCVAKWEEQGAICLGKTNMHEMGMDITNNNPVHGTPLNPYNDGYYTGGSSGGSAYAVAAGLVPVALGCDGGGSIRIPSACCGIFGLKTSHSRVSALPTPNVAGTNVAVGPMCADMISLAVAYRVMATPDPSSRHSSMFPPPRPLSKPRKKVIGIYKNWFDRADETNKTLVQAAVDYYRDKLSYEVIDISIPMIHEGQTAHAITILCEDLSACELHKHSFLQPGNRILLAVASQTSTIDFLQAQKIRQVLSQHLAHLFTQHPDMIIVTPTTPNTGCVIKKGAADLKQGISDGDLTTRTMEFVWLANFTGCPAITIPVGYADPVRGKHKVPVAMMGLSVWGGEENLIEFGFEGEKYLNEVLEGGRLKPQTWVDVIDVAAKTN